MTGFFVLPSSVGPKLRGCVCSVGSDNSVAVLSLEEMKSYVARMSRGIRARTRAAAG